MNKRGFICKILFLFDQLIEKALIDTCSVLIEIPGDDVRRPAVRSVQRKAHILQFPFVNGANHVVAVLMGYDFGAHLVVPANF